MRLNGIYERHRDVVRFICVYIKEAHPDDGVGGYRSDYNVDRGIAFDQPKTEDERAAVARHCLLRLDLRTLDGEPLGASIGRVVWFNGSDEGRFWLGLDLLCEIDAKHRREGVVPA